MSKRVGALLARQAVAEAAGLAVIERKDTGGGGGADPVAEVKRLIEAMGTAFKQYRDANDQLIQAKADGKAVSDLEAKLAKVDEDLSDLSEAKAEVDKILAKLQRPGGGGGDDPTQALDTEVKAFNIARKSFSSAQVLAGDISVEQYVAYKGAFFSLMRKGNPQLLTDAEQKAMLVGSDSDGGFLVPVPTQGRIITRLSEISPIRQIANVLSISGEALEGINDLEEGEAGWVGEVEPRDDTKTPSVGKYRIEAHEMYAQPKATQKLLDDAGVDVEGWLANKTTRGFAKKEADAFINGNGVAKPRGFATYPTAATGDDTRPWGTFEHLATGVNGDFAAANPGDLLLGVPGAFKPEYLQDAKWVTRREAITKIRRFKDQQNGYLWQPGLQAGQPDKLIGYPIVIAQQMPALAANSLSMAFGDFREGYQIVDRQGIRVLRDPFTAKPFVRFYTTRRVGGGAVNFEAIKFVKFGN